MKRGMRKKLGRSLSLALWAGEVSVPGDSEGTTVVDEEEEGFLDLAEIMVIIPQEVPVSVEEISVEEVVEIIEVVVVDQAEVGPIEAVGGDFVPIEEAREDFI